MKDLSLRSPVVLPVNIGDSTPTPSSGEHPIIFSENTGSFLEWASFLNMWLPVGWRNNSVVCKASENLTAGNLVNLHTWSVDPNQCAARRATNTVQDRQADGFVILSHLNSTDAIVFLTGKAFASGAATLGPAWLGVNGAVTLTPPTSGLSQQVGYVVDTFSTLTFIRGTPVFINP
jgi:hypothetical protein